MRQPPRYGEGGSDTAVSVPPRWFIAIVTPNRSETTLDWMMRNSVRSADVELAAWRSFLPAMLIAISFVILLFVAFGERTLAYTTLPAILLPLLMANRVASRPSKQAGREQRAYLRESPETIGTLVMNMRIQPSLEWSVGRVSETCSGALSKSFVRMGWEVLTRKADSLDRALLAFIPRLSGENDPVGRSLHLILASTFEPDLESRDRVLDRANQTAIDGVKEAADRYVASLSNPALIIFGLGIMLPVMLFSVAPLLSIGAIGSEISAASTFDGGWLFFLLLVVVPASCLLFANSALSKNPLAEVPPFAFRAKRKLLLPMGTSAILVTFFSTFVEGELLPYCLGLSLLMPACIVAIPRARKLASFKCEERAGFIAALFQIGSRMAGGASFETALEEIALNGRGTRFGKSAGRILRRARVDRVGMDELLEGELKAQVGKDIVQAFVVIARAADRDPQYAGKLALNLANNFSDIRAAEMKMDENLHGVVDMMRSTGMVFAPIVLGVTSSLMALTAGAGLTSPAMFDLQIIMAMVYLAELVFCVGYFTNFLRRERTWADLVSDFALRCPVALLIFTAISLFARTGLSQLM